MQSLEAFVTRSAGQKFQLGDHVADEAEAVTTHHHVLGVVQALHGDEGSGTTTIRRPKSFVRFHNLIQPNRQMLLRYLLNCTLVLYITPGERNSRVNAMVRVLLTVHMVILRRNLS